MDYGVVALGDSIYPNTFCFGGKRFDEPLSSFGARRIGEPTAARRRTLTMPRANGSGVGWRLSTRTRVKSYFATGALSLSLDEIRQLTPNSDGRRITR